MLVFIDDSGDAGFKLNKGSSSHFVICAVIFYDPLEVEKTALAIKEYRRSLRFPDDVEFKFFKSKDKVRTGFLKTINIFDFKVRCLVVDKTKIVSEKLRTDKNSFYSYAIKMLLKYSDGSILNAKIKIDGSGDREFRKQFLGYLKRQLNSSKIIVDNCKLLDSKNNVMIQMADMIAGSIRRSYDKDKVDCETYKNIIAHHIQDEWQFK